MNLIQYIRNKFGLDPGLTEAELTSEFLKSASKLARKGHVEVWKGGYKALSKATVDLDNTVFILIIKRKQIAKPKPLREWFKEYKDVSIQQGSN